MMQFEPSPRFSFWLAVLIRARGSLRRRKDIERGSSSHRPAAICRTFSDDGRDDTVLAAMFPINWRRIRKGFKEAM